MMKLLLLNTTGDSEYVYGDAMLKTIENSDIGTSFSMLLTAVLSSKVIPWIRDVALALIFYLGIFTIIHKLLSSFRDKFRVSCGYIVANIIMLVMTLLYYLLFTMLIGNSTYDQILDVKNATLSFGDPLLICIVLIIASIAYIIGIIMLIRFCFKNYRDMGMQVYADIVSNVAGKVRSSIRSIKNSINKNKEKSGSQASLGGDSGSREDKEEKKKRKRER